MMDTYAELALATIAIEVVLVAVVIVYVRRVRTGPSAPLGEEIGRHALVLRKLRKREPLAPDELDLARQLVAQRTSLMVFAIPAAIFTLGCFYVFGSLVELHGATPSERTFLGVIPMITSTTLTLRLLKGMRLKKRLAEANRRAAADGADRTETLPVLID